MVLDLHTLFSLLLPLIVALVAGLLRQDRLPALVNELVSYALVFGLAVLSLYIDGKIGSSFSVDYPLIVAYTASLLNSPLLKPLQQYLQSNVISFGKPTVSDPTPVPVSVDIPKLIEQIVPLLPAKLAPGIAQELTKYIRIQGDANMTARRPSVSSEKVSG